MERQTSTQVRRRHKVIAVVERENAVSPLIFTWRRELNRPGMSGDSTSWEGWSHVRWFVEEVSAGAA